MTTLLTRIKTDVDATLDFLADIRACKSDIASMRRDGAHLSASIARDEMLSRIEAWLDPDTARLRARAHPPRRSGKAMAADIDDACGF